MNGSDRVEVRDPRTGSVNRKPLGFRKVDFYDAPKQKIYLALDQTKLAYLAFAADTPVSGLVWL